tara:strand:+ start:12816 stop:13337 length:522 start_codon:yes stop_codon:yes gene_type:complete
MVKKWLSCAYFVCAGIVFVSAFSLGSALTAQYAFGLLPCNLCILQRWPYGIAIVLGLIGLVFVKKSVRVSAVMVALAGLTFLANAVIAFYHTGVERHWWKSFLEGCNVPDLFGGDLLTKIQSAPVVRCDEIPWADPILGLSMANYNVMLCLGLAVGCALCAVLILRRANGAPD